MTYSVADKSNQVVRHFAETIACCSVCAGVLVPMEPLLSNDILDGLVLERQLVVYVALLLSHGSFVSFRRMMEYLSRFYSP